MNSIVSLPKNTIHDPLEAVTLVDFFAVVVDHIYLKRNCTFRAMCHVDKNIEINQCRKCVVYSERVHGIYLFERNIYS